ncbi:MAG: hypothetical protein CVU71_07125 [Deltaproteobacteria bacterium HGW-Deltaproteobacteria-6]|jgi:hypothetical protein|nr:MAG: hypothetical protein CVU71_07125 [Deltaproteobacteria bacterium HGW-Deltaproteobacteria-6]
MAISNWIEFTTLILNFSGHGYFEYSSFKIPEKKMKKAEQIDELIIKKYPEVKYNKDKRYRCKKAGLANFTYIRWNNVGVILRTAGNVQARHDADKFINLCEVPLTFTVGSMIEIKIAKGKAGRKFTAFLSKQSFREIKAILRENIRHHRMDIAKMYWDHLGSLPAFGGILGQIMELFKWLKVETKVAGVKKWIWCRLVLRPL